MKRALLFLLLAYLRFMTCTRQYRWGMYPLSSEQCSDCASDYLCDLDIGTPPEVNRSTHRGQQKLCVRFHIDGGAISPLDIYEHVGRDAVINFVGDSNTRMLFLEALSFFGHDKWYSDLQENAKNWKNKDSRKTLDHTFLCAGQLGPTNLSLSFLWLPFSQHIKFHIHRPWSKCKIGQCPYVDGVSKCDDSDLEGEQSRWTCGASLNNVQGPQGKDRAFIVVSQGGLHDTLHEFHAPMLRFDDSMKWNELNATLYKHAVMVRDELSQDCANKGTVQKECKCWSASTYGGREIVLSPLQVRRADCHPCPASSRAHPNIQKSLAMIRDAMVNTGLTGKLYDDYIDSFELSHDIEGSVFATEDGVHYPKIMYRAQLMLVLRSIIAWDTPSAKTNPFTRIDSLKVDKDSGKNYEQLFAQSLKEYNELVTAKQLRGSQALQDGGNAHHASAPASFEDEGFKEYYQTN